MEDPEVVAAIVAGDPAGLAEAYDRYALPLYSYCRSLLREPADAADAVQDTFLVATAKLRDLRDPARLRPWLYAVARNECLRRLRAGSALSALEEAGDVPVQSAELGAEAERAEVQQLVRAAIDGLNPGERDVIELSLISELDNDELAEALGVSRNHAHALLSRARSQLERSLGALIVARTGRHACAELDGMLKSWDGQLTVLMRKRISRHIEQCEVCGERKRRELTPTLFAVDPAAPAPVRVQALPAQFDASNMVVEQNFATSPDGTKIPYFLVHRKDVTGPVPVLMHAYGGFEAAQTPGYLVSQPYRSGRSPCSRSRRATLTSSPTFAAAANTVPTGTMRS